MEDAQNMNNMGVQGTSMIKSDPESHNDLMTRRMKNRERQRRYRARKRLEADQKSHVLNQSTIQQVSSLENGILNSGMKRVHCKRDWKKDARRANMCRGQEDTPNGTVQPAITVTSESQVQCPPSAIRADVMLEREPHPENSHGQGICEITKTKLGGRDWKAEARQKKS
ncbi:hypothetical protein SLA2020_092290 [Shorea laevis]